VHQQHVGEAADDPGGSRSPVGDLADQQLDGRADLEGGGVAGEVDEWWELAEERMRAVVLDMIGLLRQLGVVPPAPWQR
jgi:hypothetical protein